VGCVFTLGKARFDGAYVPGNTSEGNTTIYISVFDQNHLHDFVFHCADFSSRSSHVQLMHIQTASSIPLLQCIYAGFNVFAKTFFEPGLWATYYHRGLFPRAVVAGHDPSKQLPLSASILDGLDSFKLTRLNRLRSLLDIEVKA
jgi:hypothetical protein